jgi:hypothetical protein
MGERLVQAGGVADDLLPPGDEHRGAVVHVADDLLPPGDEPMGAAALCLSLGRSRSSEPDRVVRREITSGMPRRGVRA